MIKELRRDSREDSINLPLYHPENKIHLDDNIMYDSSSVAYFQVLQQYVSESSYINDFHLPHGTSDGEERGGDKNSSSRSNASLSLKAKRMFQALK